MLSLNQALASAFENFNKGNLGESRIILKRILLHSPKNIDALNLFGVIESINTKFESAIPIFNKVIAIKPNHYFAHFNLGNIYFSRKEYSKAEEYFNEALHIDPLNVGALTNLGHTLSMLGQFKEALYFLDKALSISPDSIEALNNKGKALAELRKFQESEVCIEKALKLNSNYFEIYFNRCALMYKMNRYSEALYSIDRAIHLNPNKVDFYYAKADLLHDIGRYTDAIQAYELAFTKAPPQDYFMGTYLHCRLRLCNWDKFFDLTSNIEAEVALGNKASYPFSTQSYVDNPLTHLQSAQIYTKSDFPLLKEYESSTSKRNDTKIRIGYFSADFKEHPVAHLIVELFELHDKDKFFVVGFSLNSAPDSSIRSRISNAMDMFIDIQNQSDEEVSLLARDLGIDIAIDLNGHTSGGRIGIFSRRAAPVQICYLGYLGSMGSTYFDYLLADQTIVPQDLQHYYSEKIIYLNSYQINDSKRPTPQALFTKSDLGLPNQGFIYCCFNNNYKFNPIVFNSWMNILSSSTDSVLFLYSESEWVSNNLIKEAIARGVSPHRLIFAPRVGRLEYFARYLCCDLFLDTFPYNAGTTASDALWSGLPVLTYLGQSFPSRMAGSLLNAIEMPELIAHSIKEYESKAIDLATHPEKLEALKSKLLQNKSRTALFDSKAFTTNLECAFEKVMVRHWSGLPPDHIDVSNNN
jgi:predicted O-linked N-acetylglucosamine transferase (SPINDLY family)